ncbi:MAG: CPBP family intramembrane metalloprotease [Myxococcales bacterium]|nr:CPBP family intramembrane metalloprotease [Myxococcales bacterium]MDP3499763.1 CPBP family intramembrane metalloprotease [Myxococcales bacterium]
MKKNGLWVQLGVTCAFSWSLWAMLALTGLDANVVVRTVVVAVSMFGPALGAVVAQRRAGEAIAEPLGVVMKPNRWWLVAWLLPLALQPLVLVFGLMVPGVEWSPDFGGLLERLGPSLPPDKLAEAKQQLEALPRAGMMALMVGQALIAGISINAMAAFGEELGWRGWLSRHFAALGFWRRSGLIGVLWGLWHAPIILQGHNYPQHPVAGVPMMVVFCVLLAPLHELVRLRGGSVWAAAVLHGSINASAGFGIILLRGGDDLTVGVTGLAGLAALALVNGALFIVDRARGGALTSA